MDFLLKTLSDYLRQTADKIDAGHSKLTQDQLIQSLEILSQNDQTAILSKIEACKYMNMGRSTFDAWVSLGVIPKGRKQVGLKELTWTKLDLDIAKEEIKQL